MADIDERCCTCTTPEYTIKLNKQGPQGLTGPQGEPGFSPVIEVSEDTPSSYKLSIQTEEGSYETPNLKATIPTGGYTNQVLTKNSNDDGDCGWNYIPYATQESTGGVQLATTDDVVSGSTKAITGDILASVIADYVDLTSTQTITGAKTFNNNLTVGNSYTLSTYYLNARSGEIQVGGTTALHKITNDNAIPGYNTYLMAGGNLPLLLSGYSDVIRIWRDGSSHRIIDEDNLPTFASPIDGGLLVAPKWDIKIYENDRLIDEDEIIFSGTFSFTFDSTYTLSIHDMAQDGTSFQATINDGFEDFNQTLNNIPSAWNWTDGDKTITTQLTGEYTIVIIYQE